MKFRKSLFFTLVLLVLAVLIHIYSLDPARVENQYATGIYPAIGRFLRYIFCWIPFSIGDLLYGSVIIWVLIGIFRMVKAIFRKRVSRGSFAAGIGRLVNIMLLIYIVFNLLWGINYNRKGIASQLQLKLEKYQPGDVKAINALLVARTNSCKQALVNDQFSYPSNRQLFAHIDSVYSQAKKTYPFLQHQPLSLKPSMWGWLGNYMGFTGYYNPFTGEAQVNTLVPKFLQPFTTSHEVAHQLGYAREMEANFVGYLAATSSNDTSVLYSVYLDLFMYSNRNLYGTDSAAAREFFKQLSEPVKQDIKEWRAFNRKHKSPLEPIFKWVYGIYLENNQQPQGVLSYDEVTGFIIAYYKKYGKI